MPSTSKAAFRPAERRRLSSTSTPTQVGPPMPTPPNHAAPDRFERTRPVLLFNDRCEVCRSISAWVKLEDARGGGVVDARPIGDDPEALHALDPRLDIWEAYREVHVLMPDGAIKRGGAAVAEVLKRLPSTRPLSWLLDLRVAGEMPVRALLDAAYRLLDALRPALGCQSCDGPVAWWALPIKWSADVARAITRSIAAPTAPQP